MVRQSGKSLVLDHKKSRCGYFHCFLGKLTITSSAEHDLLSITEGVKEIKAVNLALK